MSLGVLNWVSGSRIGGQAAMWLWVLKWQLKWPASSSEAERAGRLGTPAGRR
jgi:hypothetical protein